MSSGVRPLVEAAAAETRWMALSCSAATAVPAARRKRLRRFMPNAIAISGAESRRDSSRSSRHKKPAVVRRKSTAGYQKTAEVVYAAPAALLAGIAVAVEALRHWATRQR